MEYRVRVVGRGKPLPIETFTGRIPPGRFTGGPFVKLEGAIAEGVDFSRRRFEDFATEGSTLVDCDFSRCRFEGGYLDDARQSIFRRCRFDRSAMRPLLFGPSRFESCSFEGMKLADWRPESAEFVDCRFSGRFDGVIFSAIPQPPNDRPERMIPWRTRNEFRGNDFSRADLRFPDFRWGVDVTANTWPSGPDYLYLERWQERLERALAAVARWEEDDLRERALWWLRMERRDGREFQQEILFRPADWASIPSATWRRLLPLLTAPLD